MITDAQPGCTAAPCSALDGLTATSLLEFFDNYDIQCVRAGYRGRDGWNISIPAPGGHYREEDTRRIGYGETLSGAVKMALDYMASLGRRPSAQNAQNKERL